MDDMICVYNINLSVEIIILSLIWSVAAVEIILKVIESGITTSSNWMEFMTKLI